MKSNRDLQNQNKSLQDLNERTKNHYESLLNNITKKYKGIIQAYTAGQSEIIEICKAKNLKNKKKSYLRYIFKINNGEVKVFLAKKIWFKNKYKPSLFIDDREIDYTDFQKANLKNESIYYNKINDKYYFVRIDPFSKKERIICATPILEENKAFLEKLIENKGIIADDEDNKKNENIINFYNVKKESLSDFASELQITNEKKHIKFFGIFFLLLILLMPIKERITGTAIAESTTSNVISSPENGTIEILKDGLVEKGDLIAKLSTKDINYEINQKNIELKKIKAEYNNQTKGIETQNSLQQIRSQYKEKLSELEQLKLKQESLAIKAKQKGLINWNNDINGKRVLKGDEIAFIEDVLRKSVILRVPINDWKEVPNNAKGVFINDWNNKIYKGSIKNLPIKIETYNNQSVYKVEFSLEEESITTASTGIVTIKGDWTLVFFWIFKKPIQYLRAFI